MWTLPASFSARHPRTAVVFLCFAGFRASCRATAELRLNMSDSFWRASWWEEMEQLLWWKSHQHSFYQTIQTFPKMEKWKGTISVTMLPNPYRILMGIPHKKVKYYIQVGGKVSTRIRTHTTLVLAVILWTNSWIKHTKSKRLHEQRQRVTDAARSHLESRRWCHTHRLQASFYLVFVAAGVFETLHCKYETCQICFVRWSIILFKHWNDDRVHTVQFHSVSFVLRLLWTRRQGVPNRLYLSKGKKGGGLGECGGSRGQMKTIHAMKPVPRGIKTADHEVSSRVPSYINKPPKYRNGHGKGEDIRIYIFFY